MAESNSEKPKSAKKFKRVTKSFNTAGGARRGEPKMTASPTGAMRSNSEGKDLVMNWVREHNGNPHNFQLTFGGDEEAGQLALYLPREGDTGMMKVSIYDNSISFHAGAAFKDMPDLRPVTKVDCLIHPDVDDEDVPCLIVQVGGASPTRSVKRKKAEEK